MASYFATSWLTYKGAWLVMRRVPGSSPGNILSPEKVIMKNQVFQNAKLRFFM